jgi:hypothetical protein
MKIQSKNRLTSSETLLTPSLMKIGALLQN